LSAAEAGKPTKPAQYAKAATDKIAPILPGETIMPTREPASRDPRASRATPLVDTR
jgi:hypothetical protein